MSNSLRLDSSQQFRSKIGFLDKYMANHNGYIAGGCFKDVFAGERIKDVDIFFKNEVDFKNAYDYFSKSKEYKPSGQNENMASFIDVETGIRVELIRKVYGDPETMLDRFDFTLTKFALFKDAGDGDIFESILTAKLQEVAPLEYRVLYHEKFFEHLVLKRVVIETDDLPFPVSTFERVLRYMRKGYYPCRETKEILVTAINQAENINVGNDLYDGLD